MKPIDLPEPPALPALPTPAAPRHDGWTRQRRHCFLDMLSATRSVSRACAAAGMSRTSAYRLRRREPAGFGMAWAFCLSPPPAPPAISLAAFDRQVSLGAKGDKGAEVVTKVGITRWHQLHQLRAGRTKPAPGR